MNELLQPEENYRDATNYRSNIHAQISDKTTSVIETEGVQECRSLALATVSNHNLLAGLSTLTTVFLNHFNNVVAVYDTAEHHMLAIQPGNTTNS